MSFLARLPLRLALSTSAPGQTGFVYTPAPAPAAAYTKSRKVTLGGLIRAKVKDEAAQATAKFDELEAYLAEPQLDDPDLNVLKWWQVSYSSTRAQGARSVRMLQLLQLSACYMLNGCAFCRVHMHAAQPACFMLSGCVFCRHVNCSGRVWLSWSSNIFATPASLAGVERIFSAAGKMHSDLRKSMKDSSLQHSIIAAYNID